MAHFFYMLIPLTLFIYVKGVGHGDPKLEAMVKEAKGDGEATCQGFRRNHGKLVKTMIVVLLVMILLFVAGLLS